MKNSGCDVIVKMKMFPFSKLFIEIIDNSQTKRVRDFKILPDLEHRLRIKISIFAKGNILRCSLLQNDRSGVLEDVLGLGDILKDTFSSPWSWPRSSSFWPWPRSLQVLENVLSSVRGKHYFLIGLKKKTTFLIVCQFAVRFPYSKKQYNVIVN